MGICKDSGVEIPDTVTDRDYTGFMYYTVMGLHSYGITQLHRTDVPSFDKTAKKSCKGAIARFSTFSYRTIVKKNMKSSAVKVKINLTKKRHNLLVSENKHVSNIDSAKVCYADANCRLKIKWEDKSIKKTFFFAWLNLRVALKLMNESLRILTGE